MKLLRYPEVIIYHKECFDGVAGAWSALKYFDSIHLNRNFVTLIPMGHSFPSVPPEVNGKHVLMVDFAYDDAKLMLELFKKAKSLTVLDHHKTSLQYKDWKPEMISQEVGNKESDDVSMEQKSPRFQSLIDMDRSGAQLAWDYFFPSQKRPPIVDYIGQRDLWKFTLPHIHELVCYIYSQEASIEWMDQVHNKWDLERYLSIGTALKEARDSNVRALVKGMKKAIFTDKQGKTYSVMIGDCCYIFRSDVGNKVLEMNPDIDFAVLYSYYVVGNYFSVSLRGKDKVDLSLLSPPIGGGGHPNASGIKSDNLGLITSAPTSK